MEEGGLGEHPAVCGEECVLHGALVQVAGEHGGRAQPVHQHELGQVHQAEDADRPEEVRMDQVARAVQLPVTACVRSGRGRGVRLAGSGPDEGEDEEGDGGEEE